MRFIWTLCFWSLFLQVKGQTLPDAQSAPEKRGDFEKVYFGWREAMIASDFAAWHAIVAPSRKADIQNEVLSQKQPWPQALFNSQITPPSLNNLIFLGCFTRAETASVVYYGKADFEVSAADEVRDNLIVLRYQKANEKWLFDKLSLVKPDDTNEILAQIRSKDFDFLKNPEFQPPLQKPPVPPLVTFPDYVAELWVTAIGFEIDIKINGRPQGKLRNDSGRNLIIGGLKKGRNLLSYTASRIPNTTGAPNRLEMALYAAPTATSEAERVFHLLPDANDVALNYSVKVFLR